LVIGLLLPSSALVGRQGFAFQSICRNHEDAVGLGLKPVPSFEYNNPAGDPDPKYGSPIQRQVVKASIGSDGSNMLVSATLKEDEHGDSAGAVLDLYIDTDGDAATGGKAYWGKDAKPPRVGYEYRAQLSVCLAYNENVGACAGGGGRPPKSRHVRIVLDKFKGAPGADLDMMSSESVISGFSPATDPFTGRVLQGKIPYAKQGLKPGQAVRISARKGAVAGEESFQPHFLLALK
jgi:hypothetical protein